MMHSFRMNSTKMLEYYAAATTVINAQKSVIHNYKCSCSKGPVIHMPLCSVNLKLTKE